MSNSDIENTQETPEETAVENPWRKAVSFTKSAIGLFFLSLALTVMTFMNMPILGLFMLASFVAGLVYIMKALGHLGNVESGKHTSNTKKSILMIVAALVLIVYLLVMSFLFYVIFLMEHRWPFG